MKSLHHNNYWFLAIMSLTLVLASCGNDDSPDYSGERTLQLNTVFNESIVDVHQDFVTAAQTLVTALVELQESPTAITLSTAKERWQQVMEVWKRCELYDVGDINDSFIHFTIQRWPIDVERLVEELETEEEIDESYISQRGSSIVGLSTIEYLLFHDDEATILQRLETDSQYSSYVRYTGEYLLTQAEQLQNDWTAYGPVYVDAVQNGIEGGQNMLANALIAYLEETIKLRIGDPFGEDDGLIIEEDLEAPYARLSLEFIEVGFGEWINVYRGEFPSSLENYGFDDFLVELNYADLDSQIEAAILECQNAIQVLKGTSLREQLTSNAPGIELLQSKWRALLVLIKVDLSTKLDITVVPNDTDGD